MPYLLPTDAIEELPGSDVLVILTSEEHRALLAIAPQLEWTKEYEFKEWMESASIALLEGVDVSELTAVLTMMKDCLCALGPIIAGNNPGNIPTQTHYPNTYPDGTPIDYPLFNGEEIQVGSGSPPPSTGAENWDDWRTYVCKATNLLQRGVVLMVEEFQVLFDVPGLTLGLLAAVLVGVSALALAGAVPVAIVTAGAAVALVGAIVAAGATGGEIMRDFVRDDNEEFWPFVACTIRNTPFASAAADIIKQRIEDTAPPAVVPILKLMPWEDWIEQILRGELPDGTPMSVAGMDSLCVDCDTPVYATFKGTGVTDCVLDHWTVGAFWGYSLYEDRVRCSGGLLDCPATFGDGIFGGSSANPYKMVSPAFSVPVGGTYKFQYRALALGALSLSYEILEQITGDVVASGGLPPGTEVGELKEVTGLEFDADTLYLMKVYMKRGVFECYDTSMVLT